MTGAAPRATRRDAVGVDGVLAALADPTRRAVFEAVVHGGPTTATGLAREFPVSRQAIAKHLDRLADAGLVSSNRSGRETQWQASLEPLSAARSWMDEIGAAWDQRLAALAARLDRRDATERTNR